MHKIFDYYVWLKHQSMGISEALSFVEEHQEKFHDKEILNKFVNNHTRFDKVVVLQRIISYSIHNTSIALRFYLILCKTSHQVKVFP